MLRQNLPRPLCELEPTVKSSERPEVRDRSSSVTACKSQLPTAKHNPFLGFIYTFWTSVFLISTSVFVKKLSYIDPGQLAFVRNSGVFVGSLPFAVYSVRQVTGPKEVRLKLFLRAFFGATTVYLNIMAFRYLPLAEASIVMSTVPAVTTVIARVYLKESCGRVQVLGLVLTLCGVLLSVRLPELLRDRGGARFDSVYLGGLASAVGCVLFFSFTCVMLRKLKDVHFSVQLLYLGFLGTIGSGVISFSISPVEYPRCGRDQIFVMLIGVFGYISHCTLTLAFQVEAAGIVTVLRSSLDIVVAMVFQLVFFSAVIDVYDVTGGLLVIASLSMMGVRKWLLLQPEDSKSRKRFRYLLL